MKIKIAILIFLLSFKSAVAQTPIFSENMGNPSGTTLLANNNFTNNTLTFSNGAQPASADVRNSFTSSGYAEASGGGNVYFTSSTTYSSYGFSIEGINTSGYNSLSLQFGYRKELNAVHATFSVDYWNGSAWATLANSSSTLFNQDGTANAGWYLSKALPLPSDAQINGLRIRFVKSGTTAIRIDDVKLTGTEIAPTVSTTAVASITSNSGTFGGNVSATGGSNIIATGIVLSVTSINANPIIGGSDVTAIASASPNSGVAGFTNASGTILSPNLQYSYAAYATKSTGLTGYGIVNTFYTLAVTPSTPIITNATGNSIHLAIGADTNSAITTYSIFETTTSKYVQADGTLGSSAVYQTASVWGNKTIVGLSPTTTYTFEVSAKNGGGVTTSASSSVNIITLAQPSITVSGTLSSLNTISGTASSSTSFTVSAANLTDNISVTVPNGFEISQTPGGGSGYASSQTIVPSSGQVSSTTLYVRLSATTPFGTYSGNITLASVNDGVSQNVAIPSSSVSVSGISDVILNTSSTTSANDEMNYWQYQGNNLSNTTNCNGVMGFRVRDGGATLNDADNVGTELTAITIKVTNAANLRYARIFVGSSPKGTGPILVPPADQNGEALLTFTGLTGIVTLDNDDLAVHLRVTFNSTVTDNQQMQFQIVSVTAKSDGSQFAAADGGGATSPITINNINRILVIADRLHFVQQPPLSIYEDSAMNPAPTVIAADVLGNRDLDFYGSIIVNSTGTLSAGPQSSPTFFGQATFNTISHSVFGTGLYLTASYTGLISANSNLFDVLALTTPIFDPVSPICIGQPLSALPLQSNNGITGTWSPALDNTDTTFYIFTPDPGQNARTAVLAIVVNQLTAPLFSPIGIVSSGSSFVLPLTSNNGITGTWSPPINNTATTTYTFTPNPGQCASTTIIAVTISTTGPGGTGTSPTYPTTPTGNSNEVGITSGELSVSLSGAANYNIPIEVPPGIEGVVPHLSLYYNSQSGNGIAGYGWNISGLSSITRIPQTKFHDNEINAVTLSYYDRFALDGQRLILKSGSATSFDGNVYETENYSNVKITAHGQLSEFPYAGGPEYFKVEYPDGSFAYYGNSLGNDSNSRSIAEYAITYWQNSQGVRINYYYTLSGNSLYISRIEYGTQSNANAMNKINFMYSISHRGEQAYVGGRSFTRNMKINFIDIVANGAPYKNYWLIHGNTDLGYERLVGIKERTGDLTKSYNPTVFTYEDTQESISASPVQSLVGFSGITFNNSATVQGDFDEDGKLDFLLYQTTGNSAKTKFWLFNQTAQNPNVVADGPFNVGYFESIFSSSWLNFNDKLMPMNAITTIKPGVLAGSTSTVTFNTYNYQYSNLTLQNTKAIDFPVMNVGDTTPVYNFCNYSPYKIRPKQYINGDFNGDGITDVIAIEKATTYYKDGGCSPDGLGGWYQINGPGITTYAGAAYFVDLDRRSTQTTAIPLGLIDTMTNGAETKLYVGDANGDGKSDLFVFKNHLVSVYTINKDINDLDLVAQFSNTYISIASNKTILLGDYNGDGKTDFIIPKGYGFNYVKYLSDGAGSFVPFEETYEIPFNPNSGSECPMSFYIVPTDIDLDGKTDLILAKNWACPTTLNRGYVSIRNYRNMGHDFVSSDMFATCGDTVGVGAYAIPMFLNGYNQGYNQEISFITNGKLIHFNSNRNFNKDRLLKSITTGDGVIESITYKPMVAEGCPLGYNCSSVYQNALYLETYPNYDINLAPTFQLVSKIELQSSTVYKRRLFSYYGAVSNMNGLGFLGFRSFASTNWHNDTTPIITSVSKSDISLRGAITENYEILGLRSASTPIFPTDPFISKRVTVYNTDVNTGIFSDPVQSNKVFKLVATNVKNFNGLNNTSQETKMLYDNYNYPLQTTDEIKNGTVVEKSSVKNIVYYPPVAYPYFLGMPSSETITTTINAGQSNQDISVKEEQYQYTNMLLSQIKTRSTNSGATTNFLTEDYIHNGYGNLTKKTITAVGLTPRETNYEYDPSGRFLTKVTDLEGLITQYDYNTSSGVLNYSINPYGQKTSYEYDKWFKKTKFTDYLLKNLLYTYTKNGNKTTIAENGDNGSSSVQTYDDLGRLIKKSVKNISGNWSNVDTEYNINGNVKKICEPYFGSTPTQFNEMFYDEYERVIQQISYTGKITSTAYIGLNTTVSDGTKSKITATDASGNVIKVTDSPGGVIDYTYFANDNLKNTIYGNTTINCLQDGWGRKSGITDPSSGTFTYTNNDFGELTQEVSPNGTTDLYLDNFGKLTSKTTNGPSTANNTIFQYDPATKQIISKQLTDIEGKTFSKLYTYNSDKKLASVVENESTSQYQFEKNYQYDSFGRLYREFSKATNLSDGKNINKWVKHTYLNGYHWQILDDASNAMLWQIDEIDAAGRLLTAYYGNAIGKESRLYDQFGFPSNTTFTTLNGPNASSTPFMTLTNSFIQQKRRLDTRGNSLFGWNESFSYDNLDRLTGYNDNAGLPTTQTYDDNGTITANNTGTYAYTIANKPYQASSVTLNDPDNINYYVARDPQTVSYNAFRSPLSISEENFEKIDFDYNQSMTRAIQYYGGTNVDKYARPFRKYFSSDGSMEIKRNMTTGELDFVSYIGGDGYAAPLILKGDGNPSNQNYFYLHRDYLGSILAISDSNGLLIEKRLFDAWGSLIKYENSVGNTSLPTLTGSMFLDRGYTGHEHLFGVGLINMNARLYDPKLHRFLSADNYVHDSYDTQSFNRYGYVLNNPLYYADPTGEDPEPGYTAECPNCVNATEFNGSTIGNLIASLGANWDNLGIKDWSNRNLNFRSFSNGLKSAGNFMSNNLKSVGGWFSRNIESMFGGHGASNELPASPNFINYVPHYAWQTEGFNVGATRVSIMYSNGNSPTYQGPNFSQSNYMSPNNPVANYDPSEAYSTIAGEGLTRAELKMYNAEANTWYSVWKMRTYNISNYNGNYYTGWKAGARRVSTGIKVGGYGLGTYGMYTNYQAHENGEMDDLHYNMEQTVATISTFGGYYGAGIGIGWELGRLFTYWDPYIDWRNHTWMPFRREHFGY